jgi:hypothetical protein
VAGVEDESPAPIEPRVADRFDMQAAAPRFAAFAAEVDAETQSS